MRLAYIDTSCLVAITFGEAGATKVASRLERMDRLFASNLLEAELRSALARERLSAHPDGLLSGITWVYPNRPLSGEFERVMVGGYVKDADLWHLACALFLAPDPKDLAFLTLDKRQEEIARRLGFRL
jgi:predicted nucleic acid-binding protein